ncbi:MAG: PLP-dependent aminotransferase family protein [SAR202 cluster bacterium]|nr:PLP-dependent aminotransferase family protein [SAR202 cluster bacterium]|tara:strand:- start:2612 stop:3811 length:1200 start_codon:yes stop_codon:yes gene_type:complete
MNIDFSELTATPIAPDIVMPEGLAADVEYVFSVTYTDPDAMEVAEFSKAAAIAIEREGLSLGTYPPPLGHEGLRQFTSRELKSNRGLDISPDNLFLSSGAGGACQTIVDAFIDPGDVVMMDEFCYHGSLNMFLRKGAIPVHVKMDEDGMDPDALEIEIEKKLSEGIKPKLIYTISVYHNPTGATLSLARRKRIVEISGRYGIPVVENESYADFRIDGPDLPPAIMSLDETEGVMYISAFTKLLGCGLRLGFGAFPESARAPMQKIGFGASPSHLSSMVVHEYLKNNKDSYVQGVAQSLGAKRDALIRSLGEYFPPECSWTEPEGGMMVWVELPEGADTWAALDSAVEKGVKYNPGPVFRADRSGANRLRLTYSHNSPEDIEKGIAILADVFEEQGLFNS